LGSRGILNGRRSNVRGACTVADCRSNFETEWSGSVFFYVLLDAFDLEFGGGGRNWWNALGGFDGLHIYKGCHRFDGDSPR